MPVSNGYLATIAPISSGSTMKLILLLCLTLAVAASSPECHTCLFGICYRRTKLFGDYPISGQLAIDRTENIVYFHYVNNQSKDCSGMYELEDMLYSEIPGISFTFARAVDVNTRDVYMSGTKGVFKYSPTANTTALHSLADKIIWHMQYNNKLYYSVYSVAGLNTFDNRRSSPIPALASYKIDDFVIDKLGDIYFLSDEAIYRLKNGNVVKLRNGVYFLSTDKNGNVYLASSATNGMYKMDYASDKIKGAGAFGAGTPLNFVFDGSNKIVYHDSDSDALYYLEPTYGRCRVSAMKRGDLGRLKVTMTQDSPKVQSSDGVTATQDSPKVQANEVAATHGSPKVPAGTVATATSSPKVQAHDGAKATQDSLKVQANVGITDAKNNQDEYSNDDLITASLL